MTGEPRLRGALASIIADPDCCATSKAIARDALTYHANSTSSDDTSGAGHTPGPWEVEDPLGDGPGDSLWIVQAGLESYQWNALAVVCSDDETEDDVNPIGTVERDANARLIAAAPELLEALENLTGNLVHAFPAVASLGPVTAAKAAIAKARGEA